jgi:hypothetical protein
LSELPTTNVPIGARAFISDSQNNVGNRSVIAAGNGSFLFPVVWNGSNWIYM